MKLADLDFLLNDFVDRLPEVMHAVAVSADGLLVARSRGLPQEEAERAAAVCAGLVSLLRSAARHFAGGAMEANMTVMTSGWMFTISEPDGASLLALATRNCDTGQVSHELAELVARVGPALTPAARSLPPSVTAPSSPPPPVARTR